MKRHGSGTKDKVFTTWNVMSKFNPENSAGNWFTIIYDLMLHNQFSVKSNQSCKILISVVYSNGVMIWELSRKYLSWLHDYSGSRATWSLRDIKRRCISGCGSLNLSNFSELNEKKTVIGWVMKSPITLGMNHASVLLLASPYLFILIYFWATTLPLSQNVHTFRIAS